MTCSLGWKAAWSDEHKFQFGGRLHERASASCLSRLTWIFSIFTALVTIKRDDAELDLLSAKIKLRLSVSSDRGNRKQLMEVMACV